MLVLRVNELQDAIPILVDTLDKQFALDAPINEVLLTLTILNLVSPNSTKNVLINNRVFRYWKL